MDMNILFFIICAIILNMFEIFQLPLQAPISIIIIWAIALSVMHAYHTYNQLTTYRIIFWLVYGVGFSIYYIYKCYYTKKSIENKSSMGHLILKFIVSSVMITFLLYVIYGRYNINILRYI